MIYFELKGSDGEVIHSTVGLFEKSKLFEGREEDSCSLNGFRQVYRTYSFGAVRIVGLTSDDALATSRIAGRTADAYANILDTLLSIKRSQETQFSIFSHNLVTTHSRLQDEIESIISEEKLAKAENYSQQIAEIKEAIEGDLKGVSESIFEIAKRIIDLQSQITGFKILSGEIQPNIFPQNLKKVLLNIIYPYYEDFREKDIGIRIYIDDMVAASNLLPLDYKLFNIAIHHFLNNALKYTYPSSRIDIRYDVSTKILSFDMISLRIEEYELDSIFDLKVSGENSKGFPGDGIGMYMIKKALKLLDSSLEISPDYSVERVVDGRIYNKNTFYFKFNSVQA